MKEARHIKFKEMKKLEFDPNTILIVEHGSLTGRFTCVCKRILSWFLSAPPEEQLIELTKPAKGLLRGKCPFCQTLHWKRKSLDYDPSEKYYESYRH